MIRQTVMSFFLVTMLISPVINAQVGSDPTTANTPAMTTHTLLYARYQDRLAPHTTSVSKQQVLSLFDTLLSQRVFGNIDIGANLVSRFRIGTPESERALLLSASASGIEWLANSAAAEAFSNATLEVDGWQLVPGNYERARDKYANWTYTDTELNFSDVTAREANKLLAAARKHGMTLSVYMVEIYIPEKTDNPFNIATQKAALRFGLGKVAR